MKTRLVMLFAIAALAIPMFAAKQPVFARYEAVRQALLKSDVKVVQSSARELATIARGAKLDAVATHATTLATSASIKDAQAAFARLSQELIAYRDSISGDRPVVVYCSMEKKSWLQPSAAPIANPYVTPGMRGCGEVVKR